MALFLETVWGDLVVDLDIDGSPELSKNFLKLAKARYYTNSLVYHVSSDGGYCLAGCPRGNGRGGASIYGYLDSNNENGTEAAEASTRRFLKSKGKRLSRVKKGSVVAVGMQNVDDTIGSQFAIALSDDNRLPEGSLSLGKVVEDENNVLEQIGAAYCDLDGRPYADIRLVRVLVVEDPFDDPPGMQDLLKRRGVTMDDEDDHVIASPSPNRPELEKVPARIQADEIEDEEDESKLKEREEEALRKEDRGRAVVLEMLGDLPDAEIKAPENVLFICKLNPVTQDEDLELIFSRFDPQVKVEIIRDQESGQSLQYAFAEFHEKQQAVEAYFKMNNALVDDRRIKVDFSQSVSKIWDKYNQRLKMPSGGPGGAFGIGGQHQGQPSNRGRGTASGRGRGRGMGRGMGDRPPPSWNQRRDHNIRAGDRNLRREDGDEFGRQRDWEGPSRHGDNRGVQRPRNMDNRDEEDRKGNQGSRVGNNADDRHRHRRSRHENENSDERRGGRDRDNGDKHHHHRSRHDGDSDEERHRQDHREHRGDRDRGHDRSRHHHSSEMKNGNGAETHESRGSRDRETNHRSRHHERAETRRDEEDRQEQGSRDKQQHRHHRRERDDSDDDSRAHKKHRKEQNQKKSRSKETRDRDRKHRHESDSDSGEDRHHNRKEKRHRHDKGGDRHQKHKRSKRSRSPDRREHVTHEERRRRSRS